MPREVLEHANTEGETVATFVDHDEYRYRAKAAAHRHCPEDVRQQLTQDEHPGVRAVAEWAGVEVTEPVNDAHRQLSEAFVKKGVLKEGTYLNLDTKAMGDAHAPPVGMAVTVSASACCDSTMKGSEDGVVCRKCYRSDVEWVDHLTAEVYDEELGHMRPDWDLKIPLDDELYRATRGTYWGG